MLTDPEISVTNVLPLNFGICTRIDALNFSGHCSGFAQSNFLFVPESNTLAAVAKCLQAVTWLVARGNKYGWGIGHYKKKKFMCNIFAEAGAFTVNNILIIDIPVAIVTEYIIELYVRNIMRI